MRRVWNPLTTVCKMIVLVMLGMILCDTTSIKGPGCLVFLSLSAASFELFRISLVPGYFYTPFHISRTLLLTLFHFISAVLCLCIL